MPTLTYQHRRGELETYFDRTAVEAWARLTSDAPVSRIRATVRAGRDAMRATLLDWLPADLRGARLLDAGCGTGALAVEAARRGAAGRRDRPVADAGRSSRASGCRAISAHGRIEFRVGDMLDPALGPVRPRRRDGFADPLPTRPTSCACWPRWPRRTEQLDAVHLRAAHRRC